MCRTLRDAAIMLGALTGIDPEDAATNDSQGKAHTDYTTFLDAKGLKGARIGVGRKYFGFSDAVDAIMAEAIDIMKREGATIVDPADIETFGKFDESESLVLDYELKADMEKYLARRSPASRDEDPERPDRLQQSECCEGDAATSARDIFLRAEKRGPLSSREYIDALEKNHRLTRAEGIDAVMDKNKLEALIAPTGGPAWVTDLITGDHFGGGSSNAAAVAGYPEYQRYSRQSIRAAGRNLVLRAGVERADTVEDRICI